jgi:hypothetical protein
MKILLLLIIVAQISACAAARDRRIAELERQLAERDKEIAMLRRQGRPPGAETAEPVVPAKEDRPTDAAEDLTQALERALVVQGGSLLPAWTVQIQPELAYTYSERDDQRRDTFVSSVTLRSGLPWELQAELFVPYVAYDRLREMGSSSDLGDINLGLSKRLLREAEYVPELLVTARWKTTTGKDGGQVPTGTGAHAIQATVTAVKSKEPIVLFATPSYIHQFASDDTDYGDIVGIRLGLLLAATPDTSLILDVDVNSSFATRVGGFEIDDSDRVSGVIELGLATILTRNTFLNITAGIGFTSAAPDFRLATSLPITFY